MFEGSTVALVTPFRRGRVDLEGLRKNILFCLKNHTSGFAPCATTGEAPSLTEEEKDLIIGLTIETVRKKGFVIAGTGTNSTQKTIEATKRAKELGVDGVLIVTPYYNKPTQEGLYRHFREVAESVDIPIVLYNVPSRTGVNLLPQTVKRLADDCKNIVAIKEASGNLDQASEIVRLCGERITLLSGDDSLTLPILSVGGKGVVSVVANIIPKDVALMIESFLSKDIEKAVRIHLKMLPLVKAMFIETNPIPVKAAMNLLGMRAGNPRLPLWKASPKSLRIIKKALKEYGLIK